ncbi:MULTISPECIES: RHS repeat-associated core domain-containing protein [unclassified Pseudomonas]|uniref:RHS repeat-associated core domain-containing protein n=1 Tax=unclassified Pseudomonas TaxID=196821 RepID=UPI00128C8D08|nr:MULTISPECIES: RHS repeat-associated core domain-containing protein [unclassified Pseudomonas]MPQ68585.1 toxin [Pseudomonas sp. MWU12-2323]
MSVLAQGMHTHTPTLAVVDPRGLAVRVVAYCRSVETAEAEERINRSAYDAMGRLIEQWDPRLWALSTEDDATPANLTNAYSLSGKVLGSISVDAGKRVSLFGDGDQLVQTWDSRGSERWVEYDDLLRPLAIFELGEGEAARCTERYGYADAGADFAAHNQCGQLIRHDDPAGSLTVDDYALTGAVLEQTQRFLSALESPDWPQGLPERDVLLEPMEQAATSATYFNPLGDVLEQIDAKGNRQLFDYTVDGQLLASHLQLSGQATPQTLVSAIAYSAYVQVEQEAAGNGVVSTLTYRPEDGRLTRLQARHGSETLQDLRYDYDPVGNVLSIEDAALPIRYFANQRVEPIKCYDYDSLYQLIEATGWEAGAASRGPEFNRFDDPGAVANYHQTYRYDSGGNLLELVHVGPQNHSRKLTAARYSNRCLPEQNDRPPTEEEIAAAFDGNGNLLELQPGQAMSWDVRNQLREVRPVERESSDDDLELYLYGGDGMRRRKVRSTQTNARSLISEVRYLPGLEIRTREGTGEVLQVICVQAGRSAMQVLHWETTPPSGITNDQYRYNLTDHLGSSSLELDSEGEVISQETYHPYGSTAWFAGRSEVEASYKTVRYSGKERDVTGLYYYGFRYYAPWLCGWINPDPGRAVNGLNFYRMLNSNPIANIDPDGMAPQRARGLWKFAIESVIQARDTRDIVTLAPGIIGVVMMGGAEVFERIGISLTRDFVGARSLFYLSIDSRYESKIVGGDGPIPLKSSTADSLNAAIGSPHSEFTAYINSGFYNAGRRADANAPAWASIGPISVGGELKRSVALPDQYKDDYVQLTMDDASFIYTGPLLAEGGSVAFTSDKLDDPKFQFSEEKNIPGYLVHANRPNNRSAISLPAESGGKDARTRLVIGLGVGRGDNSPGFTLAEWAEVTNRLDRLNATPGRSINLDGGDSSALGVLSPKVALMDAQARGNPQRKVGSFIAFSMRKQ